MLQCLVSRGPRSEPSRLIHSEAAGDGTPVGRGPDSIEYYLSCAETALRPASWQFRSRRVKCRLLVSARGNATDPHGLTSSPFIAARLSRILSVPLPWLTKTVVPEGFRCMVMTCACTPTCCAAECHNSDTLRRHLRGSSELYQSLFLVSRDAVEGQPILCLCGH